MVTNDIFDSGLLMGGTGKGFRIFSHSELGLGGIIGLWNVRKDDGLVSSIIGLPIYRTSF